MSRKKSYFLGITVFCLLENCNLANFNGKLAKIMGTQQSTKPVKISLVYNKNRLYPPQTWLPAVNNLVNTVDIVIYIGGHSYGRQ
jgi:hypothetical protein